MLTILASMSPSLLLSLFLSLPPLSYALQLALQTLKVGPLPGDARTLCCSSPQSCPTQHSCEPEEQGVAAATAHIEEVECFTALPAKGGGGKLTVTSSPLAPSNSLG